MNSTKVTAEQLNKLSKENLITMVVSQQESIDRLSRNMDLMLEQLKLSAQNRFGRQTESDICDGQTSFTFNEAENTADIKIEEVNDIEQVIPGYKRRIRPKGKREADLATITDIRIENHDIDENKLKEAFPDGYKRLPDQIYKRLEYHPAGFEVIEHHIAVYAGKDNQTIIRADRPADLFTNSIATASSLVVGIMHAKYGNAFPLYRQEQGFLENNVHISRQTMANWMINAASRYLSLITGKMKEELMNQHLIHADETPVAVRKDGRETMGTSYMWVYRSAQNGVDKPAVLYDYQKSRKTEHPREYLKGFKGVVMCDGFGAYHRLGNERDDITIANCWVHARRRFTNVVKMLGREKARGTLAQSAVNQIAAIYRVDNKLANLSNEQRRLKRQKQVKPMVDAFFAWIYANIDDVPAQSETGKGFTYCLNQQDYLRVFLDDGAVPLDNNPAERSIRPFVIGKHNWHVID